MDDFGTGYSSLGYLQSFPFDRIKIDGSFIRNINKDDSSLAIIRAVAGLSASLGMATTAEGVETEEQLERLRREGCSEIQGFLFSGARSRARRRQADRDHAPGGRRGGLIRCHSLRTSASFERGPQTTGPQPCGHRGRSIPRRRT